MCINGRIFFQQTTSSPIPKKHLPETDRYPWYRPVFLFPIVPFVQIAGYTDTRVHLPHMPSRFSIMTDTENTQTVWNFYPVKPIAGIRHIPLEEDTEFSPETFTFQFRGYKTGYGLNATLWGKKVSLSLAIIPTGIPREILPNMTKNASDTALSEEKRQYINTLREKRDALKAQLPPPADEALEEQYWQYIDSERFTGAFRKAVAIWNDPMTSRHTKCERVGIPLTEMYEVLQSMQLPGELIRDDTQFTVMLAKIMQFSRKVEEVAAENGITLPSEAGQLTQLTDTLTDRMIEGGNRLYGIPRDMTQEEHDAYFDLKLVALYSDKPPQERLSLLETLWDYPLADLDDRIGFLDQAIKLIREDALHCPDEALIHRHLSAITIQLDRLDTEGETTWRHRIVENLSSEPMNKWELAIRLQTVTAETREREDGGTDLTIRLQFMDDNKTFDDRPIQAVIENGRITDISITGQCSIS